MARPAGLHGGHLVTGNAVVPLLPGLILAGVVAVCAQAAAGVLPVRGLDVLVAVALGLLIGNLVTLPEAVRPGLRFAVKRVLQLGIVLLGEDPAALQLAGVAVIVAGIVIATRRGQATAVA